MHQSSKDRHSGSYNSSSHRYRKTSVEAALSDSSDGEDTIKKEKYKKQYGEKELKEEYSKEKGKFKLSKSDKQLDMSEVIEGFTDNEEVGLKLQYNIVNDPIFVLPIEKYTRHLG